MTASVGKARSLLAARARNLRASALSLGYAMLDHPLRTLAILIPVAFAIELAQYRPEILPGGHAVSELVRNITYGIIAAIIFEWLIVELPGRRRRRQVYEANDLQLRALVTVGAFRLSEYRLYCDLSEFDTWSQEGLRDAAEAIAASSPSFFSRQRADDLRKNLIIANSAVDSLRTSQPFMDPDVAQAISIFPTNTGLTHIYVHVDDNGNTSPSTDAHIVWELAQGSRRMYAALRQRAPQIALTSVQQMTVKDGKKVMLRARESDLTPPTS